MISTSFDDAFWLKMQAASFGFSVGFQKNQINTMFDAPYFFVVVIYSIVYPPVRPLCVVGM